MDNNGWIKLEVDNLPPDILTGDYDIIDGNFIFDNHDDEHMLALFENLIFGYVGHAMYRSTH